MSKTKNSHDPILELLISMAEDGNPAQITLNVGGWLISGYLIGYEEYMKTFMFGQIQKVIDEAREQLKAEGELEESSGNDQPHKCPRFIHLKDAKFFQPGYHPIPGNEGVLWRGRLSAVDGFVYGVLQVETP